MRSTSGRQLTLESKVVQSWRPRRFKGSLVERGQHVADIESRMVPTELDGATKVRNTEVTFVDGIRWSILTGPPDVPPTPRTRFGRTKDGRHSVGDRVATVRDEHHRVLATATWPEWKIQRDKMTESMGDHEAWAEASGAVVSASKATAG